MCDCVYNYDSGSCDGCPLNDSTADQSCSNVCEDQTDVFPSGQLEMDL